MSDTPTPIPTPDRWMALIHGTTAVPQAIGKLIETVGSQIGLSLEPFHIRRKGQAEADVRVSGAKATIEIASLELDNKLTLHELEARAGERVRRKESRRQKNVEDITLNAAKELSESVSEEKVDEDWVSQFYENCQDVSNENMQVLWSRILAGEVTKPGTFSLRTLAFCKTLGQRDASLFTRFGSLCWKMGYNISELRPLSPFSYEELNKIPGVELKFDDFVRLEALGLIAFQPIAGYAVNFKLNDDVIVDQENPLVTTEWWYFDLKHTLTIPLDASRCCNISVGRALLTDIGQELVAISGATPNEQYRQLVISHLRERQFEVETLGVSGS